MSELPTPADTRTPQLASDQRYLVSPHRLQRDRLRDHLLALALRLSLAASALFDDHVLLRYLRRLKLLLGCIFYS